MKILETRSFPKLATLYLARFGDDPWRMVEFADVEGRPDGPARTLLVSTQVGCPVGCRMCDAGAVGYRGNLNAEDILGQIRHMLEENPAPGRVGPSGIVVHFARMGEPSLNPAVLEVLKRLDRLAPDAGFIPSLSTVAPKSPAVRPFYNGLIAVKDRHFPGGRFRLQFSVHSTDPKRRSRIVPIRKWELEEIADYGCRFFRPGDRKVVLNFALEKGDGGIDVKRVAGIFCPEKFLIQITPVNPTWSAKSNRAINRWEQAPPPVARCVRRLKEAGYEVLLSPQRPEEIAASATCGQLWSQGLNALRRTLQENKRRERGAYISVKKLDQMARGWMESLQVPGGFAESFRPDRAALLIVDMQDFYLNPHSTGYQPAVRAILANVMRLVEAFRRKQRPVYFSLHHPIRTLEMPAYPRDSTRPGETEACLWRGFGAGSGEPLFVRSGGSAFTNTDLSRKLKRAGIESVVVAGSQLETRVEPTVRDASISGFKTFVACDAAAAVDEAAHSGSLKVLAGFSRLVRTKDLLAAVSPGLLRR